MARLRRSASHSSAPSCGIRNDYHARSRARDGRPSGRTRVEATMKISARNVLKGKVKQVTAGAVNTEVVVELPGGQEIVSIITRRSADDLALARGKDVYAVVKASNVILMTD